MFKIAELVKPRDTLWFDPEERIIGFDFKNEIGEITSFDTADELFRVWWPRHQKTTRHFAGELKLANK